LLLFLFGPLVDFLCSSRGFVYLSFFYIPPLTNALFFPLFLFLNTKYRVVDLLHRLTFALVPSLKSRCRSLMKLIFICFLRLLLFFFSVLGDFTKERKKNNLLLKPHANMNQYKLRPLTGKKNQPPLNGDVLWRVSAIHIFSERCLLSDF